MINRGTGCVSQGIPEPLLETTTETEVMKLGHLPLEFLITLLCSHAPERTGHVQPHKEGLPHSMADTTMGEIENEPEGIETSTDPIQPDDEGE